MWDRCGEAREALLLSRWTLTEQESSGDNCDWQIRLIDIMSRSWSKCIASKILEMLKPGVKELRCVDEGNRIGKSIACLGNSARDTWTWTKISQARQPQNYLQSNQIESLFFRISLCIEIDGDEFLVISFCKLARKLSESIFYSGI